MSPCARYHSPSNNVNSFVSKTLKLKLYPKGILTAAVLLEPHLPAAIHMLRLLFLASHPWRLLMPSEYSSNPLQASLHAFTRISNLRHTAGTSQFLQHCTGPPSSKAACCVTKTTPSTSAWARKLSYSSNLQEFVFHSEDSAQIGLSLCHALRYCDQPATSLTLLQKQICGGPRSLHKLDLGSY